MVEGVGWFGELVGGGSRVEGRWVVGERGGDTGTYVCSDRTFFLKL